MYSIVDHSALELPEASGIVLQFSLKTTGASIIPVKRLWRYGNHAARMDGLKSTSCQYEK
jgi:hypothetical protein